jgi:hypothetical protein
MKLSCKHITGFGWVLVLIILASSCSSSSTPGNAGGTIEGSINCHAFYRATSGEALTEARNFVRSSSPISSKASHSQFPFPIWTTTQN